jgi:hypothetical protein
MCMNFSRFSVHPSPRVPVSEHPNAASLAAHITRRLGEGCGYVAIERELFNSYGALPRCMVSAAFARVSMARWRQLQPELAAEADADRTSAA